MQQQSSSSPPSHLLWKRLVIVGDEQSGKTWLIHRFITNRTMKVDVSPDFQSHHAIVDVDGKIVDLAVWDTPGLEDYDRVRPVSYPNTHVILICFSVEKRWNYTSVCDMVSFVISPALHGTGGERC
jgi:small GTP-binding protein